MKFSHFTLSIFLFGFVASSQATEAIKVGLFNRSTVKSAEIEILSGPYHLMDDQTKVKSIEKGAKLNCKWANGNVEIRRNGNLIASGRNLKIIGDHLGTSLSVKPAGGKLPKRSVKNNLWILGKPKALKLVNELDLESYVGGVIEAEAGRGHTDEYYKVQAIICRTYALANKKRHYKQGFNVCDQTHCQVYHGIPTYEPKIPIAVQETNNLVIVDADIELIVAAFHSNCGGQTIGSDEVWIRSLPYLMGKKDTFCLAMPHSNWEKEMPRAEWNAYLQKSHQISEKDTAEVQELTAYFPKEKEQFFVSESYKIPMKTIRKDLGLRSSFFTVHSQGDVVHIVGQGFGHGVGLCQEGAMARAKAGMTHQEILKFYFTNVHLINLDNIDFFAGD